VVAMGACEKLRVAAAVVSLCVRVAGEDQVGRDSALERQRVADLEAMLCECDVVPRRMLMLRLKYRVADVKSQSPVAVSPYSAMTIVSREPIVQEP
jgi:hypothetical protein